MKPKNFLTTMLLLFALIAGSVSAWAVNYISYNGTTQDYSTAIYSGNVSSGSAGNISWSGTSCSYGSNRVNIAANGGITFTAESGYQITKIVMVTGTSADYVGTWSSTSGNITKSSDSKTVTIDDINANSVTITTSSSYRCTSAGSISIYYTSSGGSTPSITAEDVNIAYDATNGSIAYTINNEPDPAGSLTKAITAGNEGSWLTLGEDTDSPISFTCTANEGNTARKATVTLTYAYGNNESVTKNVIITQAKQTLDYAILPFAFDGGRDDIENTDGLTQNDLDADYGSSPKLKFNGTGDWVILHFKERPGTLTFDIKGNTFSGGTFTVQTSEDGETYTSLKSYTELGSTQSEEFNNLGENVRYIKWIYTEKVSGNVALGNIALAQYEDVPVVPTNITVTPTTVEAPAAGASGTLTVTYNNFIVDEADVIFCDANGDAATYNWVTADINSDNNVDYVIEANDGAARTAYMKVYALDSEANEAYSGLITITQAKQTLDYAILPFAFDGGKEAIEDIDGLTQDGLDSDYSSSPYLKFDDTSDCVILHFNERPGKLTFDIKGNPNSDSWYGTFTVQTSEDGVTYTDLKTYEDLTSTVQHEKFYDLDENVRYIKWIFTTKNSGNVALGNIALAQYVSVPTIITTPAEVEIDAAGDIGTLTVDYYHITTVVADVIFCEANGDAATYNWVTADINSDNNVDYVIEANDGAARTAYMKVYALDDNSNYVYSNLITITQAAYVAPAVGNQYKLFSGDLVEGDYIIYYNGYAMNNDVQSGRLMYAEVTPENDVITTSNAAIVWHIAPSGDYWTIYNAAANAYAASTGEENKAQMLADGTYNTALWTVSGDYTNTYEFVNKANDDASVNSCLRKNGIYGFACYSEGTGGDLSLYKKVTVPVTVPATGFSTYVNATENLDFTGTGITPYVIKAKDSESVTLEAKMIVAKDEPVLLYANGGATANVPVYSYATAADGNLLVAGDGTSVTYSETNHYYVLATVDNLTGFYRANNNPVPVGKAYLDAGTANNARFFALDLDGESTGIAEMQAVKNAANGKFYNLNGQQVAQPTKGLYIVNGRKIVVK